MIPFLCCQIPNLPVLPAILEGTAEDRGSTPDYNIASIATTRYVCEESSITHELFQTLALPHSGLIKNSSAL